MKKNYPFDPLLKNHLGIALGFGIWIFIFLFFTEPLDIQVFSFKEKLTFLPLYALAGAIVYILALPFQQFTYTKNNKQWFVINELMFFAVLLVLGLVIFRILFLFIVHNYTLWEFIEIFFLPAVLTLLPIIILSRWAFGRYFEKKLEETKIEIKGSGNYENLRLFFNDIVYIQSADNYIEVSYLENSILKKALIRSKISSVKETFPKLLQTHRSYIINSFHFKQWQTKNSKTELLLINDITIPVSKTYLDDVKTNLNNCIST
jgi:hypothetical protein